MTITFVKSDSAEALKYFGERTAFTSGPIELNRAINEQQNIVVVDVREAEDLKQGHVSRALSLPRGKWSNPVLNVLVRNFRSWNGWGISRLDKTQSPNQKVTYRIGIREQRKGKNGHDHHQRRNTDLF